MIKTFKKHIQTGLKVTSRTEKKNQKTRTLVHTCGVSEIPFFNTYTNDFRKVLNQGADPDYKTKRDSRLSQGSEAAGGFGAIFRPPRGLRQSP